MATRKLFQIDVGVTEKGQYEGQVFAVVEKKGIGYRAPSLRTLIPKLRKAILQKDKEMRRFPLPEESRILSPNGERMFVPQS